MGQDGTGRTYAILRADGSLRRRYDMVYERGEISSVFQADTNRYQRFVQIDGDELSQIFRTRNLKQSQQIDDPA